MKKIMQKGGKSIHSKETKDNYENNTEVVPIILILLIHKTRLGFQQQKWFQNNKKNQRIISESSLNLFVFRNPSWKAIGNEQTLCKKLYLLLTIKQPIGCNLNNKNKMLNRHTILLFKFRTICLIFGKLLRLCSLIIL